VFLLTFFLLLSVVFALFFVSRYVLDSSVHVPTAFCPHTFTCPPFLISPLVVRWTIQSCFFSGPVLSFFEFFKRLGVPCSAETFAFTVAVFCFSPDVRAVFFRSQPHALDPFSFFFIQHFFFSSLPHVDCRRFVLLLLSLFLLESAACVCQLLSGPFFFPPRPFQQKVVSLLSMYHRCRRPILFFLCSNFLLFAFRCPSIFS